MNITITSRYIFREMIPPFFLNLLVLTFLLLMTKILELTNLIISQGVGLSTVILMLVYSMPYFLIFVIPMSAMLAILLAFLRLSSDNEIIALKASGVSIYRLLPPVFIFCLISSLATAFVSIHGLPWGTLSFKRLAFEVGRSHADIALKERTFIDSFKGVILYVNKIDTKDRTLNDVFVVDKQEPKRVSTIVARRGKLLSDPEKFLWLLRLYDGSIGQVSRERRSVHTLDFKTYDFALDLGHTISAQSGGTKDETEMSLSELRQSLREAEEKDVQYFLTLLEYHKKFSIPFACFVLGLVAVPLGIQFKTAKRSSGIVLGLFFFLLYYVLLAAGWSLGETGNYPPVVGMWVPNLVLGAIGLYLMFMTARERPVRAILVSRSVFEWFRTLGKRA
ncbi:MAG: LPS export ABC transporter permease LptF [Deltaproteobacteria bacterium]|nr:LPS export ABC transporter permease LptF [Deltaproteobacteria bacterium]MBW2173090.1 LPS export ABC transporter permease LptF [Deltaproteobacteria bacterium]